MRIFRDDGYQNSPPGYGLNTNTISAFMSNYKSLSRYTYLWPPMDQASTLGSKWQLIENLDIIAHLEGCTRPKSRLLEVGSRIPKDVVLKRTHSESGNHIVLPQDERHKRTWEYMNSHSEVPRCKWFAQTYVPLLKDLGEWRVIVVGGNPIYTVHTQPSSGGTWKRRVVTSFWPLDALQ